ncbi:hypothetical protein JZ751_003966 [Albula glossodonta]|uniref:Uncharacterized protein n=1 Tax=Albula glossodonta TaxID=121402 RepID=A0A8T2P6Q0_9TELE|nr:hypothetical protein JZ751_003966 [Albula glossodonta]
MVNSLNGGRVACLGVGLCLATEREERRTGRHMFRRGGRVRAEVEGTLSLSSDVGGDHLHGASRWGYCFEGVPGAALTAGAPVEGRGLRWLQAGVEGGAGASPGVALLATCVADELADGAQRGDVLVPALQTVLLVLDGVPSEEDEDEAHKLEAGSQAKVDKSERGDIVFPAGAMDTAVLLPQHAGGVNDRTKVDGCRNVGWGKAISSDLSVTIMAEGWAQAVISVTMKRKMRKGMSVLQVGLDDDQLELVALATCGRCYDLSALDAGTVEEQENNLGEDGGGVEEEKGEGASRGSRRKRWMSFSTDCHEVPLVNSGQGHLGICSHHFATLVNPTALPVTRSGLQSAGLPPRSRHENAKPHSVYRLLPAIKHNGLKGRNQDTLERSAAVCCVVHCLRTPFSKCPWRHCPLAHPSFAVCASLRDAFHSRSVACGPGGGACGEGGYLTMLSCGWELSWGISALGLPCGHWPGCLALWSCVRKPLVWTFTPGILTHCVQPAATPRDSGSFSACLDRAPELQTAGSYGILMASLQETSTQRDHCVPLQE